MNIQINDAQLQQFIDAQVKSGGFPSATAVVEAALARVLLDDIDVTLTEDDLAAIEESERQIERGECRDWKEVSAELRKKYLTK